MMKVQTGRVQWLRDLRAGGPRVMWLTPEGGGSGGDGDGGDGDGGGGRGSGGGASVKDLRAEIRRLERSMGEKDARISELEGDVKSAQRERDKAGERVKHFEAVDARKKAFDDAVSRVGEGKKLDREKAWTAFSKLTTDASKAAEDAQWAVELFTADAKPDGTVIGGTPTADEKPAAEAVDMNDIIRKRAGVASRALA